MVALNAVPITLKIQEIESASSEDENLQTVQSCLISGNWEQAPKPYAWVHNKLTGIDQVNLCGTRIMVPNTPLWPQANGEVKQQNRSLLKAMTFAHAKGRDWRLE